MMQTPESDILAQFAAAQQKSEMAEVVKELFTKEKLFMITDLTRDEIRLLTRIYAIAELKNIETWKNICNLYATLVLSGDRKSRKEILDAIRGYSGSMMSRLNPRSWGRSGRLPDERMQ